MCVFYSKCQPVGFSPLDPPAPASLRNVGAARGAMAYYTAEKSVQEFRRAEKEVIGGLCSLSNVPLTPESQRDQDRRIRREIANSNERRRMQSINAGFQSLKVLLPHADGEKLSKAAILQQTAEYIFALEEDKTRLMQQNAQLKRMLQEYTGSSPKRKRGDESDEGIGSPDSADEELAELRQHLEKERLLRLTLEEKVKTLECQLQPSKMKEILHQAQLQQEHDKVVEQRRQLVEQQGTISIAQLPVTHSLPAPTHHPTVIVPAPLPPSVLQVNVVTMAPSTVINSVSTSKQNLDTIVQAIQHIEATEQGIKEEPVGMEKQVTTFLNLDGMQECLKEDKEWHELVTSPLIKSSFGDIETEGQDTGQREMLAALRSSNVEMEPVPSALVPGTSI